MLDVLLACLPYLILAIAVIGIVFGVIYASWRLYYIIERRNAIEENKTRQLKANLEFDYEAFYVELKSRPKQLQPAIEAEPVFESWKD